MYNKCGKKKRDEKPNKLKNYIRRCILNLVKLESLITESHKVFDYDSMYGLSTTSQLTS